MTTQGIFPLPLPALTQENFDAVTETKRVIVIQFWSEDCFPCRQYNATFLEAAEHFSEALFATINVEEEPELAADFSIQALPTTIIMREQFAVFCDKGILSKDVLFDLVHQAMILNMAEVRVQLKLAEINAGI